MPVFAEKYGSWALVAGASEGLGAAFATALASRGLNLILVARRMDVLTALADEIKQAHSVKIKLISLDLADLKLVEEEFASTEEDIGLLVYNAAYSPIGYFKDLAPDQLLQIADINVKAPLLLAKLLSQSMLEKKRGGIILMSSLSGLQGSPKIATYSATKAFNTTLAEALWREFKDYNVDVLACVAGAIRTPGYIASQKGKADAPGTLDADVVANNVLDNLGKGPTVIPGFVNKLASFFLTRLLPRKRRIEIMFNNTKDLT